MRRLPSSILLAPTLMMYLMSPPLDAQQSQPVAANRFEKNVTLYWAVPEPQLTGFQEPDESLLHA